MTPPTEPPGAASPRPPEPATLGSAPSFVRLGATSSGRIQGSHQFVLARWLLLGIGVLFLIIVGGCVWSLVRISGADDDKAIAPEKALSTIQAVLTTSIGILGSLASSIATYYYGVKNAE